MISDADCGPSAPHVVVVHDVVVDEREVVDDLDGRAEVVVAPVVGAGGLAHEAREDRAEALTLWQNLQKFAA